MKRGMGLHRIKKKPNDYFVSRQNHREKKYVTLEPEQEPNPKPEPEQNPEPEPNESRIFC
jgi:hypothetical protein